MIFRKQNKVNIPEKLERLDDKVHIFLDKVAYTLVHDQVCRMKRLTRVDLDRFRKKGLVSD